MKPTEDQPATTLHAAAIAAKLLRKIKSTRFGPQDWQLLAEASRDARLRRALGHLRTITPRLVRQLAELPAGLFRPRVLSVLNRLRLSPERWRALRAALETADSQRRATLASRAGQIQTEGDLWDYWHEALVDPSCAFHLPQGAFASKLLEPLTTPQALHAEGQRMDNCLSSLVREVRAGQTLCFRPRNRDLISAELVAHNTCWRVGRILGHRNAELGPGQVVRVRAELQRLAEQLNQSEPPVGHGLDSPSIRRVRACARARFSATTIARVIQPLAAIRARSVSATQGAFVIFQVEDEVYIQFLAALDGRRFLCEVSSHKYQPYMHARLSERVVTLLEKTGFYWPEAEHNFQRWFMAEEEEDLKALAEFSLGMLSRVGGLRPGATLGFHGHIPAQSAPTPPPSGWEMVNGALELKGGLTVCAVPGRTPSR